MKKSFAVLRPAIFTSLLVLTGCGDELEDRYATGQVQEWEAAMADMNPLDRGQYNEMYNEEYHRCAFGVYEDRMGRDQVELLVTAEEQGWSNDQLDAEGFDSAAYIGAFAEVVATCKN